MIRKLAAIAGAFLLSSAAEAKDYSAAQETAANVIDRIVDKSVALCDDGGDPRARDVTRGLLERLVIENAETDLKDRIEAATGKLMQRYSQRFDFKARDRAIAIETEIRKSFPPEDLELSAARSLTKVTLCVFDLDLNRFDIDGVAVPMDEGGGVNGRNKVPQTLIVLAYPTNAEGIIRGDPRQSSFNNQHYTELRELTEQSRKGLEGMVVALTRTSEAKITPLLDGVQQVQAENLCPETWIICERQAFGRMQYVRILTEAPSVRDLLTRNGFVLPLRSVARSVQP